MKIAGLIALILSSAILMPPYSVASENLNSERRSRISLNVASEALEYREYERDTGIESKAGSNNLVIGIEGQKRWRHFFSE